MLFGASSVMFVAGRNKAEILYSYVILVIASFAQIMGLSDNAILSTGAVLALIPVFVWKNSAHIIRHCITIITYLAAMKITSLITLSGIETMNDLDPSTQITMGGKSVITLAIVMMIMLTILLSFHIKKANRENEESFVKKCKFAWNALIISCVVAVIGLLIAANSGWNREIFEPYKNMLILDDDWGTGRGLAWSLGMKYWINDSTMFGKLFGYGPDTYYIITMDRFMNIMQNAGYGIFDSAHNEYFEYFITAGVLGLIAYVSFIILSVGKIMKSQETTVKAAGMAVIAYAAQAVVSIAIPITTPVFMLLIYVGLAGNRSEK